MNIVFTIIVAVLVFGAIILIHELGHFVTAKSVGIKVNEFSLGMGPCIWKTTKKETQYSIRMFPIGGFVSMEGEDIDSGDKNAFCNKKVWQRVLVIVNGAVMNILLGFAIMLVLVIGQQAVSTTTVAQFNEGATSNVQLQQGDEILSINGRNMHIVNDILFEFMRDKDGLVDIEVRRSAEGAASQTLLLPSVPFVVDTVEEGVQMLRLDFKVYGQEKTFTSVLKEAFFMTTGVVKQVYASFFDLITGNFAFNQLSGPVGVTGAIGEAASMGGSSILLMVAFITINIGVFNLLPIPALDGGRLLFLLIEGVFRKPIPAKYEGYVHATGLVLLLGLMVVVTFNDIFKLFTGGM